jgi:hypothetical protein
MKNEARIAVILLAALALVIAGVMVETYWECRAKVGSYNQCVPPIGGATFTDVRR